MKIFEVTKNLGNIRILKRGNWLGTIGEHKGFAKFESVALGNRALIMQLRKYFGRKLNTISKVVNTWAPESDGNKVVFYINFLVKHIGIPANQIIVVGSPEFVKLFSGIVKVETSVVVGQADYNNALTATTKTPIYRRPKKGLDQDPEDLLPLLLVGICIYYFISV